MTLTIEERVQYKLILNWGRRRSERSERARVRMIVQEMDLSETEGNMWENLGEKVGYGVWEVGSGRLESG